MIERYSLQLLEKALNVALSLDEAMPVQLQQFESKVIEICITPLQWRFYMRFEAGRLVLLSSYEGASDTVIYSSPLGLIRLSCLPASQARSLFHDGVRIEGDVQLGQALKRVMDTIDIDWEGHLARFTGDMAAYQLGRGIRGVKGAIRHMHASFTYQLTAYMQEEALMLPAAEAIRDFCDDVDQLVLDVDRLEAKLNIRCKHP